MKKYLVTSVLIITIVSVGSFRLSYAATNNTPCDPSITSCENQPASQLIVGTSVQNQTPAQQPPLVPNVNPLGDPAPTTSTTQNPPQSQTVQQQQTTSNSGFVALAPIPGLTDTSGTSVVDSKTLAVFFNNLYRYLIGIAATLAILIIIRAGIYISINQGDSITTILDEKSNIRKAILGLLLVLSPVLVFSVINPSILNLSVDLPALDTATPSPQTLSANTASQNPGNVPVGPKTGCTTAHTGPYLESAVCKSRSDIEKYTCINGYAINIVGACRATDPTSKQCIYWPVYCAKPGIVVEVAFLYKTKLFVEIDDKDHPVVVPRDAELEAAYRSGCTADGGAVSSQRNEINTHECSSDAGNLPVYDPRVAEGYKCRTYTNTCVPK